MTSQSCCCCLTFLLSRGTVRACQLACSSYTTRLSLTPTSTAANQKTEAEFCSSSQQEEGQQQQERVSALSSTGLLERTLMSWPSFPTGHSSGG